jgi:hypothetical protein
MTSSDIIIGARLRRSSVLSTASELPHRPLFLLFLLILDGFRVMARKEGKKVRLLEPAGKQPHRAVLAEKRHCHFSLRDNCGREPRSPDSLR